jgi:hypothetical protein
METKNTKKLKQEYLRDKIINGGYEPADFEDFIENSMGSGNFNLEMFC